MTAELSVGAALAADLRILARLHDREPDAAMLRALKAEPVKSWFGINLAGPEAVEGMQLLEKALADIVDPDDSATLDELAAEYAAIYLTYSYRCAPTESVWRDEENLERQSAMFLVRGWYDHYGMKVPNWRSRSDDHLVHELEFLAALCEAAGSADRLQQPARFLRDHPLVWVPEFCRRVVQRCLHPFYGGVALLTLAYLERLAALFAEATGEDMTPAPLELPRSAAIGGCGTAPSKAPTCADPPSPRYVPGIEPSW